MPCIVSVLAWCDLLKVCTVHSFSGFSYRTSDHRWVSEVLDSAGLTSTGRYRTRRAIATRSRRVPDDFIGQFYSQFFNAPSRACACILLAIVQRRERLSVASRRNWPRAKHGIGERRSRSRCAATRPTPRAGVTATEAGSDASSIPSSGSGLTPIRGISRRLRASSSDDPLGAFRIPKRCTPPIRRV